MMNGHSPELVRSVGYGPDAVAALRAALTDLRGDDLLALTEVAVPSAFTGATVRRRLADPGLVGVRFAALPRLIAGRAALALANPALAGPGLAGPGLAGPGLAVERRRPLTAAQRRAATWAVLVTAGGRLAEAARRSPAAVDVAAGVFAELDDAEAGAGTLAALAEAGGWAAELARRYPAYLAATASAARPAEVIDAACRAGGDLPLVVYLPRWLTAGELRFCRSLAGRGLLRVILGFTGEEAADADAAAIREALAPGAPAAPRAGSAGPPRAEVRGLPDPEEEVRYAIRRILARLAADGSARPDRIGIAYRAAVPYARLLAEQLAAAGLPHHPPRQRALTQSVAGRTLLGLLGLPAEGWSRVAVLDLLRDVPVTGGRGGRLPVTRWQRLAREAGVTRGLDQWQPRLEQLARQLEAAAGEDDAEQAAAQAAACRSLAAFVTSLAGRVAAVAAAPGWPEAAAAARAALAHCLGGPQAIAGWGLRPGGGPDPDVTARCDVERDAYQEVTTILGSFGELDPDRLPISAEALRDVLGLELSGHLTEAAGVARGVLAGPLWDFAGADLDLLIVVGAAEGRYPPRGREHVLVGDEARARAGLRTLAGRRGAERRDHLAALAAAPTVVVTHPVADIRAQRAAEPAPWLLELTSPRLLAGEQPPGEPLRSREQRATAPPSFEAAVRDRSLPPATVSEYDVRLIMAAAPAGPGHPLAAAVPALARGLAAASDRAAGIFGPWTGALTGPLPEPVTARLGRPLSATSLQEYAECPFRYFLASVLAVRVTREPDEEQHDPLARGSAVHAVLEQLVQGAIDAGKPPDEAWTAAEHGRAQVMLAEHTQRLAAVGKAGRPAVWAVQVARWRRQLHRALLADDAYRAAAGARPLAVEHGFGPATAAPPVAVDLPGGPVELAGFVDRIDRTGTGELVVIDYKTGSSGSYGGFPADGAGHGDGDFTGQGRRLQLPLYALVARRDFAAPQTGVSAFYWFVDEGGARRGGTIGEPEAQRFREVLGVIAAGVRAGAFPARPGEFAPFYRSFGNCRRCAFDRVCGQDRGDLWQRVRLSPRATAYSALAEPPASGIRPAGKGAES